MDDLSSGGDSKMEEDSEKRSARDKEGKDHDREEGIYSLASANIFNIFFTNLFAFRYCER